MKSIVSFFKLALTFFTLFCVCLIGGLWAEVDTMDEKITAYEFLMGSRPGNPIVAVESANRVVVQLPDSTRETVSPDPYELQALRKPMKPVGRVTICKTEARSERESRINKDVVAQMTGRDIQIEMGETSFTFELVSDRDLKDVYVALFLYHANNPADQTIKFGNVGDLGPGDFVRREIAFPNTTVTEGMQYRFEFFCNGSPLEMYMLPDVAMNPASHSLQIPWSVRLNCYLNHGRDAKRDAHPRPWKMGIKAIDLEGYKARGATDMKIKIRVKTDGSVELLEGDTRMTGQEVEDLRQDVSHWEFFPELKKGKPEDKLVAAPLKL